MKLVKTILRTLLGLLVLAAIILTLALWLRPPELLRVGANYAAKIVCSNVFLARRDPEEVLRTDVQAPGVWLLRLMRVSVDHEQGAVRAGLLGFIGNGLAVNRPGAGCAVVPDGKLERATLPPRRPAPSSPDASLPLAPASNPTPASAPPRTAATTATQTRSPEPTPTPTATATATTMPDDPTRPWPDGDTAQVRPIIDQILTNDRLAGPGFRALIVVDHGHLVAERYAPGFTAQTPQLGWSMTKSVTAGLIGILVQDGKLSLDQPAGWPPGDGRDAIRIADLMAMSSGLHFNEGYGAVSDVTRMLYLEPDMAAFAHAQPLARAVGEVWSYSSGSALILSRIIQDTAGPLSASFANDRLFTPLGMRSTTLETDEHGTYVGSSYMYATARDWAKYAQFLLQDGVWHDERLLPPGFTAMMATPVAAARGEYGRGLVWLWGSSASTPGKNPDTAFGIPEDCFWMEGHDGQIIAIIPSRQLVVVRLGLTPVRDHYIPQPLVAAVIQALAKPEDER